MARATGAVATPALDGLACASQLAPILAIPPPTLPEPIVTGFGPARG